MKFTIGPRFQRWTYWLCRLIVGVAFISAAILKIAAPQDFADTIAAYRLMPFSVINLLALGLPIFELVCGLSVLSGLFFRIGTLGVICMLVVFIAALSVALMRGLSIDCGCFGSHSWLDSDAWAAVFRDGILLELTVLVYRQSISDASIKGSEVPKS